MYGAGYSAGGETMSRAVTMRPDLYTAYLHGASQWDGEFDPIAENSVAVYVSMAENDEYYRYLNKHKKHIINYIRHIKKLAITVNKLIMFYN